MQPPSSPFDDELYFLLHVAAGILTRSTDPTHFLDWIAKSGPVLAPAMAAAVDPAAGDVTRFYRLLGVQIYNITPLADLGFITRTLPMPGRNAPCICGSGRKYKQCCARVEALPPLGEYNMLLHVLDHIPRKSLAPLPQTKVDTYDVADVAAQWIARGDDKRALALLEPWFKADMPLSGRQLPLFDELMDLYLQLNKPLKRKRLLERACNAADPLLQASAMQRKATILMDEGNPAGAWEAFKAAQRLDPESPALSMLEITLLCANGEIEQAKARATFWLTRLRRSREQHPELMSILEQCTVDPRAALFGVMTPDHLQQDIATLSDLLQHAPPAKARYKLEDFGNEAMMKSAPTLSRAERHWEQITDTWHDEDPWQQTSTWLPLLRQEPELWQSVTVLNDLLNAVMNLFSDGLPTALPELLLQRALLVLQKNLDKVKETQTLPWVMLENRTPLRLLARIAFFQRDQREDTAAFIALAERLITLCPNDNLGMRGPLSVAYLEHNLPEKVIALRERFADDILCTLPLNYILALFRTGAKGKALTQLAQDAQRFSAAIDMLLAKSPRQPSMSAYGIQVGGKDEAWIYRQEALPLWQQHGALAWLQQASRNL